MHLIYSNPRYFQRFRYTHEQLLTWISAFSLDFVENNGGSFLFWGASCDDFFGVTSFLLLCKTLDSKYPSLFCTSLSFHWIVKIIKNNQRLLYNQPSANLGEDRAYHQPIDNVILQDIVSLLRGFNKVCMPPPIAPLHMLVKFELTYMKNGSSMVLLISNHFQWLFLLRFFTQLKYEETT